MTAFDAALWPLPRTLRAARRSRRESAPDPQAFRFVRGLLVESGYAVQHVERHVFECLASRVGSDSEPSECHADIAIKLGRDLVGRLMNVITCGVDPEVPVLEA